MQDAPIPSGDGSILSMDCVVIAWALLTQMPNTATALG